MRRAKRRKRTPVQQTLARIKKEEARRKPWQRTLAQIEKQEEDPRRKRWRQLIAQVEEAEKRRHEMFQEVFFGERETVEDMMSRVRPAEPAPSAPVKKTKKKKPAAAPNKRGRKPYPIWKPLIAYLTSVVNDRGKRYRDPYTAARDGLDWAERENKNKPANDKFVLPDFDTVRDKIRDDHPDLVEENGD